MSSKKWILTTFSITIVLLLILASLTYLIDPLYQYQYSPDNKQYLNSRYSVAGLIKNYDYDSVILGSSMTQNFLVEDFKNEMSLNPLKVTMGGMNMADMKLNMELINDVGKCKTMFVAIDLHRVADERPVSCYPEFLYTDYSDDYRYLLNSDMYTRFIPLSIILKSCELMGRPIPSFLSSKTDIHKIEYWNDSYSYGEERLLKDMSYGRNLSPVDTNNLTQRMHENIDDFFGNVSPDTTYYIFFPPYSAFYWENCEYNNYLNEFLEAREYFYTKSQKYKNVVVYDFQNIDQTIDFSYYKDISHYSGEINTYMVECFVSKKYVITDLEQVKSNNEGIREKVVYVKENYPEILNSPQYK